MHGSAPVGTGPGGTMHTGSHRLKFSLTEFHGARTDSLTALQLKLKDLTVEALVPYAQLTLHRCLPFDNHDNAIDDNDCLKKGNDMCLSALTSTAFHSLCLFPFACQPKFHALCCLAPEVDQ